MIRDPVRDMHVRTGCSQLDLHFLLQMRTRSSIFRRGREASDGPLRERVFNAHA